MEEKKLTSTLELMVGEIFLVLLGGDVNEDVASLNWLLPIFFGVN
jgi:hypothetical protein